MPVTTLHPATKAVTAHLTALFMHHRMTGSFPVQYRSDLPQMRTADGIALACDPDLRIGITLAPRAFGLECGGLQRDALCNLVLQVLADLDLPAPAQRPKESLGAPNGQFTPSWTPAPSGRGQHLALALDQGSMLRLSCLDCIVDPCFNDQRIAGARLIVQIARA